MQTFKDRGFIHPVTSEITPQHLVLRRRQLMQGLAAGAAALALPADAQSARPDKGAALPGARSAVAGAVTVDKPTPYSDAASYNNF